MIPDVSFFDKFFIPLEEDAASVATCAASTLRASLGVISVITLAGVSKDGPLVVELAHGSAIDIPFLLADCLTIISF